MVTFQSFVDRLVIDWAKKHGYACHYGATSGGTGLELRVYLSHARVSFVRGRLDKLTCRNDGNQVNEMVHELARLFALCGYIEMLINADEDNAPKADQEADGLVPTESAQTAQPTRYSQSEQSLPHQRFKLVDSNANQETKERSEIVSISSICIAFPLKS